MNPKEIPATVRPYSTPPPPSPPWPPASDPSEAEPRLFLEQPFRGPELSAALRRAGDAPPSERLKPQLKFVLRAEPQLRRLAGQREGNSTG
jgi:hypothetical protein